MADKKTTIPVHHPKTLGDFEKLNGELMKRGFVALDALKPGIVRTLTLGDREPAESEIQDMMNSMNSGTWCNGPIKSVAWLFDDRSNTPTSVSGPDGKPLGLGYVRWGAGDNIPSTIPPLAQALPYTAAPLRYIADLTCGLGVRLMYRFADGTLCGFREAGDRLLQMKNEEEKNKDEGVGLYGVALSDLMNADGKKGKEGKGPAEKAYEDWEMTWFGYDETAEDGVTTHVPGAKEFLEENDLDLHLSQCEQDDVMLDIYFPTVGLQRGRRGAWNPKIVSVGLLPAHSVRLEKMNEYRHINHVYFSDVWRTKGAGNVTTVSADQQKYVMYPAAMPQHRLSDLRYIVESNQRTRIKDRPTWVVCPTFYPSLNKPYYPQPAWWSIFTSKAFDFSSTILYDKAKARENSTSWGKIMYISLDYLDQVFADDGYQGNPDAQQEFIAGLEQSMEDFLQHRENHGKMMRQWMWTGQDGKEHHNVEIVDVAETTKDAASAGKDELELSTSPIFLALQVDPRLVGVPMVHSSNGGTALREMHLIKQQQLNIKQRIALSFYNTVARFNRWDEHAEFHIIQQTLTTLDNSKTGTVETIAGEQA